MNANPGELWQYNSGGVIVIAAAARRLTGVPFHEYARTSYSAASASRARCAMYLSTIASRTREADSICARWISDVASFGGHRTDYGRLWWSFASDANGSTANRSDAISAAIGNLNQWLFVVPRDDLVVVVTCRSNASSPASFFFSDILPAVALRSDYLRTSNRAAHLYQST